ncbi:sensor histidine kinase [Ochrovirga pacifica]|uniref:sensor histidine kinase n=1 Tax=Ochrovirga pacifica TaxID=1042376 RepID=UPI0002558792|nr:histidine kinase [Ochrovirga pacifica]
MNKYVNTLIQNKWWQEFFILITSFVLFTLNDWIHIHNWRSLFTGFVYFLLLYIHAQINRAFVLPFLLKKHQPIVYVLISVVLLGVFTFITYHSVTLWIYKNCFLYKSIAQKSYTFQAGTLMVTLICIVSISLIFQFYRDRKRLDKEKILNKNAQLNSLKEQLNPHFLFNTFNTLYGISLKYPERVSELIMHVSQLMRYQLGSSDTSLVEVTDEIEFLKSYVKLEKERVGYRCDIDFNCNISTETHYKIAPMLLIVFVENAFKHGTASTEKSFVSIQIEVIKGQLKFCVKNSIPKKKTKIESTKIGLKNTLKRLELIYEDQYTLDILEAEKYSVRLEINLNGKKNAL